MDADDVSLPERLSRQTEFMRAHPHGAVLGTGAEYVDEQGRSLGVFLPPEQHEALVFSRRQAVPLIHPSVMVGRSFLEALGGYDERLPRSQDADLWLRGYRRFRYHNLQEVLIRYRCRSVASFRTILAGAFVRAHAAYREGRLSTDGWGMCGAYWPMICWGHNSVTKMRAWKPRLR